MLLRQVSTALIVAFGGISLAACANVYKGVPLGYYTVGSQPLTKEKIAWQDKVVEPRCIDWAKQTNPSSVKAGVYTAWNHGWAGAAGGLIGSSVGYKAEAATVGAHVTGKAVSAIGVDGAIIGGVSNAVVGGVSGWENNEARKHYDTRSCAIMDAENVHAVPPEEAKRIASGQQPPTDYAAPWQHETRRPEQKRPYAYTTPQN